jgi:hypothetical protein
VRLGSANRSFAALAIGSLLLGVYVLCGAVGCVLLPLIVSRLSDHGFGGLVGDGSPSPAARLRRRWRMRRSSASYTHPRPAICLSSRSPARSGLLATGSLRWCAAGQGADWRARRW